MAEVFQFTELKDKKIVRRPKVTERKYSFKDLEEVKFRKGKKKGFSLVYGQEKRIEGKKFLEAAKQESNRLVEEAKKSISGIEKAAYEKGEQKALEDGKLKLVPVLETFQQKINELVELKKKVFTESEEEILELSLSLASRVISQEVRTQKDLILGVIKTATKKILGREQIVIRINPEDMQFVLQNKPKFKDEFKDIKQVSFKEDTSIGKGGCVIDTEYGSISAILDEEFDQMAKHLRRELEVSKEKEESGE